MANRRHSRTFVEWLLYIIGGAGMLLSLFLVVVSIAGFLVQRGTANMQSVAAVFLIGCAGVVISLILMAIAQALNTFRLMAHNKWENLK